jgi:hypothetical protein
MPDGPQPQPGNDHWRAVCAERRPYRSGRTRRKRTQTTGTSPAAYFTLREPGGEIPRPPDPISVGTASTTHHLACLAVRDGLVENLNAEGWCTCDLMQIAGEATDDQRIGRHQDPAIDPVWVAWYGGSIVYEDGHPVRAGAGCGRAPWVF